MLIIYVFGRSHFPRFNVNLLIMLIYVRINLQIPIGCKEIHHEIELGVVVGKGGRGISEADSMSHVAGYVLALDMTARDFQNEAKSKGHPWTMAKCFDTSCPIGEFIPKSRLADPHAVRLVCAVNGEQRQDGSTADMIFSVPHLVSYISDYFTLEEGDLILTGTPAGVGPVKAGDSLVGEIPGVAKINFSVVQRSG